MSGLGWGRRLLGTHVAVLAAMGLTAVVTATMVGPAVFTQHMHQAGHGQPAVLDHAEQAFRAAGAVSLVVGLGVALVVAVATAWLVNRNLARGLDALIEGAARVSRGDYDQPVRLVAGEQELGEVAEEFNQMAAQIASTENTRRRMLTDLGHELRTPLAAVQVTLEGLQDGVVAWNDETLDVLLRQNQRLTALAADISAVSRAEEGVVSLDLEPVELDQFVVATTSAHRRLFQDAGVGLRLQCDAGAVVDADPGQLCQVLDNLLRNALQHTKAGDRVDITTRLEDAGARVALEVADTGGGINADALPHLFERFYRDDSSRTRDVDGGTGVGLSISRAIVSSLNGSIEAHSDGAGRGARFTVRLPTSPPQWALQDDPAPT